MFVRHRVVAGLVLIGVAVGTLAAEIGFLATIALACLLTGSALVVVRAGSNGGDGTVTPWARPRCAACRQTQRPGVRLLAGPGAYVCEPCVRRFQDLLDVPEDITRIL